MHDTLTGYVNLLHNLAVARHGGQSMQQEPSDSLLHGTVLKKHTVCGLNLIESIYPPSLRLPRHSHQRVTLFTFLEGGCRESYLEGSRTCQPLSVTLYHPDESHSDHFYNVKGRLFLIEMEPEWLARVRAYSPIVDHSTQYKNGPVTWLVTRLYDEFRNLDPVSPLAIEGLMLEIFSTATRRLTVTSERKPPMWLQQAKEDIQSRFFEPVTLCGIAESHKKHPVHLAREFRKYYRSTVGDYVRQLRIDYACQELSRTDTPIVDIALTAGFSHQSHFSLTFKRITGLSPGAFRSRHRSR
jgi:AraC family transcriptional regulator